MGGAPPSCRPVVRAGPARHCPNPSPADAVLRHPVMSVSMSVVSKSELQPVAVEAAATAVAPAKEAPPRNVKPLLGLIPFVMRYPARVAAALVPPPVAPAAAP